MATTRRRTTFTGIAAQAVRELIGLQDDLGGATDQLRAEAIGTTTDTKTAKFHAAYNQRCRVLFPAAGDAVSFPPANSQSQNKWIEVIKIGGGNIKIVPTSGLIQGAASVTLTTSGFYYFQSDGLSSWWMQPTGGGGGLSPPVVLTDLQTIAANSWLGNITGGVAAITVNTLAQLKTYIGNMSAGTAGLAPAGSGVATQFLNGNGSYTVPASAAPTGAANTLLGNPTAAPATDIDIAVGTESIVGRSSGNITTFASAVQTCMIRAAGSLFFASAAAGQHLRRSLAGGDLGFSALEVGVMSSIVADAAVGPSSVANVSASSFSVPANVLVAGSVFRFVARGIFSRPAAPPTLTWELVFNGTALTVANGGTLVQTFTASAAIRSVVAEGLITVRSIGAGGVASAFLTAKSPGASNIDGQIQGPVTVPTTFTWDTTAIRTIELRVRMTTSVAATLLTLTQGFIERLK